MATLAKVLLWGTTIGAVSWDQAKGCATFQYSEALQGAGIKPSPLTMPVSSIPYTFQSLNIESYQGLPGMLADALPDKFGNAVIDQWLARQGRDASDFNPVERLCYMGQRAMGALEFQPTIGDNQASPTEIDVAALTSLASEILQARSMDIALSSGRLDTKAMTQILEIGTSAGGARAKALIAWNQRTGSIRSGHIAPEPGYEYWLLKFDGVSENSDNELADPQGYGRIEYAYSELAKAVGIEMTQCQLIEEGGRAHFVTKRFDRDKNGSKTHMQTLCALGHYDYQLPGGTSYEQAFKLCSQLGLPMHDKLQLFSRMVFNVAMCNRDDHTKNISFLMDRKGVWRLSPAYDLMFAYNPKGAWTAKHQMSINAKQEAISREDLLACAKSAGLNLSKCKKLIDSIIKEARNWPAYAQKAGVKARKIESIKEVTKVILSRLES